MSYAEMIKCYILYIRYQGVNFFNGIVLAAWGINLFRYSDGRGIEKYVKHDLLCNRFVKFKTLTSCNCAS